ncbi:MULTISPECIES: DMT family transporter [unclassified Variovorax]|uniref:DMT family transporter n=1 Tax=unclassified Variovorax TaxID=663243 RepID=UPI00076C5D91|nr:MULTISPECIES: DMT family transporter [unclassified Variovorax]KWT97671.1 Permease of the drug/metabolite transporter (DMT) superfamily [Variovorax sp. WDL1]PNG48770.1 putative cystine transporter YijE [Variovorax sp. B2]PNG49275.1 putative cystine transporter YijE [Variovorax sp. B4]VTV18455.1 putative inner membrane transporter yiJE [Variovorax sp. WDL1]
MVIVLTLVWGTSWVLFPIALREISIWTFRAVSLLASGVLLLLAARAKGLSLFVPVEQRWPLTLAAWVYLVIWNICTTYSSLLIPSGQAAVLGFTMPIWAALISWLLLGERPSTRLFVSILLAGTGVACLAYAARGTYAKAPLGFLLGLSGGIAWAAGTLILKRAGLTVPLIVSTGWQLIISGIPIAIAALLMANGHPFAPSWSTVIVIAYLTVVPMALGGVVWFSIAGALSPTLAGLSTVMVPMVAMVTGAWVHGEPLGPMQLTAMACCGASLMLVLVKS